MYNIKIKIVYDNWCPKCTRFAKLVKMLDWLNLVDQVPLRNLPADVRPDVARATKAMAGYFNNKWNYGYPTIQRVLLQLPVTWILVPLIWILGVTGIGERLYNSLAVRRNIIPIYCDESCGI